MYIIICNVVYERYTLALKGDNNNNIFYLFILFYFIIIIIIINVFTIQNNIFFIFMTKT